MTPPEGMLRYFDLSAFFAVNLCRVPISPPFPEHCNLSYKSWEKPVRRTVTASQAHNLFGPKLESTQGDIAEADVFNATWTGSSIILSRVMFYSFVTPLKKDSTVSV